MQRRRLRSSAALHARPLDRLVRTARRFVSRVTVRHGAKSADGKAVVALLLLAVPAGADVEVEVDGPDEAACLEALAAVILGEAGAAAEAGASGAAAAEEGPAEAVGQLRRRRRRAAGPAAGTLDVSAERARLQAAFTAARRATDELVGLDELFADVFRAQRMMLDDPVLQAELLARLQAQQDADSAVEQAFAELGAGFDAMEAAFAAQRASDVTDVGERLRDALALAEALPVPDDDAVAAAGAAGATGRSEPPVVWVVEEATPSFIATVDRARVAAVVSHKGGHTSHAAIIARARALPLFFLPESALGHVRDGDVVRVGADGRVLVLPAGESWVPASAAAPFAALVADGAPTAAPAPQVVSGARAVRAAAVPAPVLTRDGTAVPLRANLGAPGDLAAARAAGAAGCGLLRTELIYAGRRVAPDAVEQAGLYERVARALAPHPLVVRLFDAGSDKPLPFLPGPGDEPNPQLGRRGAALLRDHPDVTRKQLEAIAEARRRTGADVRALIPMVVDLEDVEAIARLAPLGLSLGAMIETPAAALGAATLAPRLGFVSLGTNDLTQYVLARDRQGGEAGEAPHPAVLRLVQETARAAAAARIECSLCGELAGDASAAPLLVAMGVGALSMAPTRIGAVRRALAAADVGAVRALVPAVLAAATAADVRRLLRPQDGGG
ncbi:MAG TPA: HPr family phosphocarrier protein [Myxococcota bacterium]|jgi:phosphotransferase system HPr (HPr) family protein|nr:HPr family phosphocarrier protein [Myxococcota bacterium]